MGKGQYFSFWIEIQLDFYFIQLNKKKQTWFI